MIPATMVPGVKAAGTTLFWLGSALASLHIGPGEIIVAVGAVVWALASYKSKSTAVVRQENLDLVVRNETLEKQKIELLAENVTLRSQPSLEQHAVLLQQMIDQAASHDQASRLAWAEMAKTLMEVRTAVMPPR